MEVVVLVAVPLQQIPTVVTVTHCVSSGLALTNVRRIRSGCCLTVDVHAINAVAGVRKRIVDSKENATTQVNLAVLAAQDLSAVATSTALVKRIAFNRYEKRCRRQRRR